MPPIINRKAWSADALRRPQKTWTSPGDTADPRTRDGQLKDLAKIPGLDQKIGEAIAAYRDANGAFKSLSDLANIEGIDAGLLEKIKPFLTL